MSEFAHLSLPELRKKAKDAGLASTGTREALQQRLEEYVKKRPPQEDFFALRPAKKKAVPEVPKVTAPEPEVSEKKKDEEPSVVSKDAIPPPKKYDPTATWVGFSPLKSVDGTDPDVAALVSQFPEGSWKNALAKEFTKPYFVELAHFVAGARARGTVFPPPEDVFSAFRFTPLEDVKVMILGQDPYIHAGEAHGLCFSVRRGIKVPPSLVRVYTVLEKTEPGFRRPRHGYLEEWARRGVFMLNAVLTVDAGKSNSHKDKGWEQFTDAAIRTLSARSTGMVCFLWGKFAQKKAALIDRSKHTVLQGPHPSPLAGNAFMECTHFIEARKALEAMGKEPVDWSLTP